MGFVHRPLFKKSKTGSAPLSASAPSYLTIYVRTYKVSVEHKLHHFMANWFRACDAIGAAKLNLFGINEDMVTRLLNVKTNKQ